jgi:putative endopeptidase
MAMVALGIALLASAVRAETPADILRKDLPPVLDPRAIERSAEPCSDFYEYACGAWRKATPIPPDQSIWWRFSDLDEHIRAVLATILEDAAAGRGTSDENSRKISDYYASCNDEAAIEAKGLAPFAPELERIAALDDKRGLALQIARLHRLGSNPLFSFSSTPDYTDASMIIPEADQDGFALPDRDYYFTDDFASERADYREHLKHVFTLLGDDPSQAEEEAAAALRIEIALAKAAMGTVKRRVPKNIHHKMTLAEFEAFAPSFDWAAYFSAVGAPSFTALDVVDPGFFKGLEPALKSIPLQDWKSYLSWTFIHGLIASAPKAFVDEDFAFFGKRLDGQSEIAARWKRCVDATEDKLGDALGQAFVARVFSAEAKSRVLAMVREIEATMAADIKTLDWMGAKTKERALEKLGLVADKIGYPDKWRDYSKLTIVRGDALGNDQRASDFELQYELRKIGKPTDRSEWSMSASANDAYYDEQLNDINFPAGALQVPNFDLSADDAANYGALGAVIGHELTHGFDDEGRHYDGHGNLNDWWKRLDAKAFEARAAGLIHEYDTFIAVKDPSDPARNVHVDGELTLGENVADNGGIRLAYSAFLATSAAQGGKDALGYTPSQRFFLSYAQSWCVNSTDAFAKEAAKTDLHSPGEYRVNGVLMNMLPFRQVFDCKVGTPMAPAVVHRVW